jgi:hypothetical protein
MKSQLKRTILGVVALTTMGADRESAPSRALSVATFGNRETVAAAARDEEHPQLGLSGIDLGLLFHKMMPSPRIG